MCKQGLLGSVEVVCPVALLLINVTTTFSADSLLVTSPSSPPSGILCGAWRWSVSECSTSIKGGGSVLGRGGAAAHRGSRAEGLFKQRRAELGPSFHPSRNQTALAHPSQIPIRYTLSYERRSLWLAAHRARRGGAALFCLRPRGSRYWAPHIRLYTKKRYTHTASTSRPRLRGI